MNQRDIFDVLLIVGKALFFVVFGLFWLLFVFIGTGKNTD